MSLGGGLFTVENKVMPGAYINFVSTSRGSFNISDRGVGAMGIELDWGPPIIELDADSVREECVKKLGYDYNDDKMLFIREFFRHGKKLYAARINYGGNVASCDYGFAKYTGIVGNELKVVVSESIDYTDKFVFNTYFKEKVVDTQTVATIDELVDTDYITWDRTSVSIEAGIYKLGGGKNNDVTGGSVNTICKILEKYRFNCLTMLISDEDIQQVMVEFTKRMRDERGVKFQYVAYDLSSDYEGIINVVDNDENQIESGICAWVCGVNSNCAINESLTNMKYDGELNLNIDNSYDYLEKLLKLGKFVFYKSGDEIRVLKDINSLIGFTTEKGQVFQNNQTVRVCDQIATDTANLFINYYLGKVPNDKAGRSALWSELVKYHEKLNSMRAIEEFDEDDIEVSQGEEKTSVIVSESIVPVNSMDKLYMKVYIE
ncbi:MAG: phage tail sheath C-terminal domain-containing protein [Lachnospirales bacterium]